MAYYIFRKSSLNHWQLDPNFIDLRGLFDSVPAVDEWMTWFSSGRADALFSQTRHSICRRPDSPEPTLRLLPRFIRHIQHLQYYSSQTERPFLQRYGLSMDELEKGGQGYFQAFYGETADDVSDILDIQYVS